MNVHDHVITEDRQWTQHSPGALSLVLQLDASGHHRLTSAVDLAQVLRGGPPAASAGGGGASAAVVVVVQFRARWCSGCHKFAPQFDRLAGEAPSSVVTCCVDVDEAPELADAYGASELPLFVIFRDGRKWGALVGGKATQLRQKVAAAAGGGAK